jgi:16S rRNA C1402 N4-methylase RsmH
MNIREILGGIYTMVSEDENLLIVTYFSNEDSVVKSNELTDNEMVIAEDLVRKGLLLPHENGFRLL